MTRSLKDILIIVLCTLATTLLIWLPHLLALHSFFGLDFSAGFNTIYRNFDGLEYVIIAKTFYDPAIIATLPQSLPAGYYAAHFPGYALFILVFATFLGFLKSMLFVSVLFTIASAIAFYYLVKDFKLTNHPLLLSVLFLILPARWLIVHTVGSSEPVFIFFVIVTFYFLLKFEEARDFAMLLLSALAALSAQLTRPPGALLGIALALYVFWKYFIKQKFAQSTISSLLPYSIYLLIPLGLLGIFYLYSLTYHDFFAYFHSGDNIHLTLPPFPVFNKNQFWVGDIWLEEIVYLFIFGLLGGIYLWKRNLQALAFFVFTYVVASMFVAHRDISRYILPTFPFILIAFEKLLTSKEFRIVLVIVTLAIYLYAQNFIIYNVAPYPNLELFN